MPPLSRPINFGKKPHTYAEAKAERELRDNPHVDAETRGKAEKLLAAYPILKSPVIFHVPQRD